MLAEQYGKLIRDARERKGLAQTQLARKARVSRTVVSSLERGKSKAVQADTLDRLFAALELDAGIGGQSSEGKRRLARLEHELKVREQRERHLRLAIELAADEAAAAPKVARARERVELWKQNRSCSPFYIQRWSQLLAQPPRQIAKSMSSLGEWQDAMFQNSPWSWAWT
jgi:transcriptional regulator with XRE-family HTH domain